MRIRRSTLSLIALVGLLLGLRSAVPAEDWKPVDGPLKTRWAKKVSPDNALPEYPRPQLRRQRWENLNGLWDYALTDMAAVLMPPAQGRILVPFPVESSLSGVGKRVGEAKRLWYRTTFNVPSGWRDERVLLHFGAVDWEAAVTLNGKELGAHKGGYDGFSFDITDALKPGQQELIVRVWDPSDAGPQPRGKQVRRPEGIWYTPTTGIWQTVWLEPVPKASVRSLNIVPDVDRAQVRINATLDGDTAGKRLEASGKGIETTTSTVNGTTAELTVIVPTPALWSPEEPNLYDLRLTLTDADGKRLDRVDPYFGMRKISLGRDERGLNRMLLNNKPYFQMGPLDQGFWPDGIYTAPTDDALKFDIEATKRLGFNMARKHVKVEPDRWYYWCDRLGLLVWQDMPSGDRFIGPNDPDIRRSPESAVIYQTELKEMIDERRSHPSIVMWVPYNEGWGQWETNRIADWVKGYDPSRLVDSASGWADREGGDVHDFHVYPGPGSPQPTFRRAAVLGEYGGLGLPLEGHTWQSKDNWGYRTFATREELTEAFQRLQRNLHRLIGDPGLSAAVYTQTTDVEVEVNGLMTYDREIVKMDPEVVSAANRRLQSPPPTYRVLMPTSRGQAQTWRYTTKKPADAWSQRDFDDSGWSAAPGGFGTAGTPGAVVRTQWNTPDIWLRREFTLPDGDLREPEFLLHHDEDVEIYVNGVKAAALTGYSTDYFAAPLSPAAVKALKSGKNVLAVHCRQTGGGQYIDVGIQDELPPAR
jgi:hypothetical protein